MLKLLQRKVWVFIKMEPEINSLCLELKYTKIKIDEISKEYYSRYYEREGNEEAIMKDKMLKGTILEIIIRFIFFISVYILSVLILFFIFTDKGVFGWILTFVGIILTIVLPYIDKYLKGKNTIIFPRELKNATDKWWNLLSKVVDDSHNWIEKDKKEIIRTDHKLELWLYKYDKGEVKAIIVTGVHEYRVYNPYKHEQYTYELDIFTDIGEHNIYKSDINKLNQIAANDIEELRKIINDRSEESSLANPEDCGGFSRFLIDDAPCNNFREGVYYNNTKENLRQPIVIPSNGSKKLAFHIYGVYSLNDRLPWIFQEFCDGLELIINKPNTDSNIRYELNHNHEKEIKSGRNNEIGSISINLDTRPVDIIKINVPIYPNQGFTLRWNFK